MKPPFTVWSDADGNLYMQEGTVILLAATTTSFAVGGGAVAVAPATSQGGDVRELEVEGGGFAGGSGTNLGLDASQLGTLVPFGLLRATEENIWRPAFGEQALGIEFDPGDGSAELSDATDVIATLPAGATIAPYGTLTATTYGQTTYNGGAAWTAALSYEGAAQTWPVRDAYLSAEGSTMQDGSYTRTGWQAWESAVDPTWTLTLDGTGAGEISDGTDIVATRAADAALTLNPTGAWASTSYGATNYGPAADVATGTPSAGTFPTQGYLLADTTDGVETWVGQADDEMYLTLDTSTGDSLVMDAADVVAERLAGSTSTPDGTFTATAYGIATYHTGAWTLGVATAAEGQAFAAQVALGRGLAPAGYLWVELTLDGSDEVTAVDGPFWGAALPSNSSTLAAVPVAYADGAGNISQIQVGPIFWRPAP